MADDGADPDERLREELDELHERLAALTGRVADLERDRDALYVEAEAQGDRMERAEARLRRYRHSVRKAMARAAARKMGEGTDAVPPDAGSTGKVDATREEAASPPELSMPGEPVDG